MVVYQTATQTAGQRRHADLIGVVLTANTQLYGSHVGSSTFGVPAQVTMLFFYLDVRDGF